MDDVDFACHVADAVGRELLHIRQRNRDSADLGDRGDAGGQAIVSQLMAQYRPDDCVLSEEAPDDVARLTADRVWIIDPVDGTRQFAQPPRTDWAVHVALWERDTATTGQLTVGAVALPAVGAMHSTADAVVKPSPGKFRIAVSHNRVPAIAGALATALDAELVHMGSAGVKGTAMLRGEADAYIHTGGQSEWDNAAPVVVARSAGLHASQLNGSSLVYNKPDPEQPELLICAPELADQMLSIIRSLTAK